MTKAELIEQAIEKLRLVLTISGPPPFLGESEIKQALSDLYDAGAASQRDDDIDKCLLRVDFYMNTKHVDPLTRGIQINEAQGCAQAIRSQEGAGG